jgi:hypothetical protein
VHDDPDHLLREVEEIEAELHVRAGRDPAPALRPHGSPFCQAWLSETATRRETSRLEASLAVAWHELCEKDAWRDWFSRHGDELDPAEGFSYVAFDDRRKRLFRGRRDGLSLFVPIAEALAAPDAVAFMRQLIVDFFSRRAEMVGVEPPGPADA